MQASSEVKHADLSDFHDESVASDNLEGEMNVILSPQNQASKDGLEFNTLDEPIRETIMRDLKAVGRKFFHVLYPRESKVLLKEWDLWGPLMLCIMLAIMIRDNSSLESSKGPQFAEVFLVYWLGSAIVTLNIKLLGGNISFFQGVCVLGYCVMPLSCAAVLCHIIELFANNVAVFVARCIVIFAALVWSVFASTAFLADCQPLKRMPLAIYPIFLFYFFISWMILLHR